MFFMLQLPTDALTCTLTTSGSLLNFKVKVTWFFVHFVFLCVHGHGRRSLWEMGDTAPNIWAGDTVTNVPQYLRSNSSNLHSFHPCNIFLIVLNSFYVSRFNNI